MRTTIPSVRGERLYRSETDRDPIVVGTPAWYDCLEQQTAFTFVDQTGTFTVRKSMLRTGGSSWKAYFRHQGKLYRIHLGHTHALSLERLQAAARSFAGEPVDVSSTQSESSRLPMHTFPRMAITVDHPMALMQTKLYRPRNRSDLISRARLLERLNAGLSGKVTLVSAPTGFGKTTLLATVGTDDRSPHRLALPRRSRQRAARLRTIAHRRPAKRLSRCVPGHRQPARSSAFPLNRKCGHPVHQ